ncbi:LPFR motif small protein [Streptomyces niveus]
MRAIADALRAVGGAIATVVMLPFRLVAKLFSGTSRGGGRARRV